MSQFQPPQAQFYQQPPASVPPPAKKSRKRLWLIIAAIVVVIAVAGAIGSQGNTSSTDISQPTPVPTKPLTLDQQINQIVQNAGSTGSDIVSHYNVGGDKAEVIDEQTVGGFDNNGTIETMKVDCFALQKALWASSIASQLSDVTVRISGQLVDQYGKTSNGMIGNCELSSATAHKFQWDNLTQDDAWKVYDNTWLLPSLTR